MSALPGFGTLLLSKEVHQEETCLLPGKLGTLGKRKRVQDGDDDTSWVLDDTPRVELTKEAKDTLEILRKLKECKFTGPERKEYYKKLRKSQGFDVGDIPDWVHDVPIIPVRYRESDDSDPFFQELRNCSKLALQKYNSNKRRKTKYEFVKLLKVTVERVSCLYRITRRHYYLTFEAKEVTGSSPQNKNFQARVFWDCEMSENTVVELCRPKAAS